METPYFEVLMNLPHAGTVALRMASYLVQQAEDAEASAIVARIRKALLGAADTHPPTPAMQATRDEVAHLARDLVSRIEQSGIGSDRLGQLVRNLFECLGLGREGAQLSLQAGEDPQSLQRPV